MKNNCGKYKPYPAYKPSGVEWLGEIPEHWEVRKLKLCSRCNSGTLPENTNPNYEIEYLDIGNVDSEGNILATENYYFADAPSRARRIPKSTDTIISTVRTYLKAIVYLENMPKNFMVVAGIEKGSKFKQGGRPRGRRYNMGRRDRKRNQPARQTEKYQLLCLHCNAKAKNVGAFL